MQVAGKAYTQERNEMITLSLDEFGDFEGIKGDNNPIGIAGILYDDGGNKEMRMYRLKVAGGVFTVIGVGILSLATVLGGNSEVSKIGSNDDIV